MKSYTSYGEFRYGSHLDLLTGKNILLGLLGIALFFGQSVYLFHESTASHCSSNNLSTQNCYPSIRVEKGIPFKSDTQEWTIENGVKAKLVSTNYDSNLDKINFAFWVGVPFALAALIGFIRDRISTFE